ncbi:MAG: hypothetical protein J5961_07420 [Mogibacterium sp.]|nr:hypothetical protein [Mogibacterium sp.]
MRKAIVFLMSLLMMCFMASCSMSDYAVGGGADENATVTGSGEEYLATVDDEALSCHVEYLGTSLDVNEGEFVQEDEDEGEFFVLRMTFWNELSLMTHDSDVDDIENKDSMERSYVIRAIQGDEVIEPRDEVDAETFEEQNVYELIDAGDSIECEYWFPVDASQPVTIQILNPDGEDTVMAELTFPVAEE